MSNNIDLSLIKLKFEDFWLRALPNSAESFTSTQCTFLFDSEKIAAPPVIFKKK